MHSAILVLLYALPVVLAHTGHTSSSTSSDEAEMMMMVPYLHFTPGDTLLFKDWIPQSAGAIVGSCIGLFLLALVDRWIAATRAVMEVHWLRR